MDRFEKKNFQKKRRQRRARNKISGTSERPRLVVYRSLREIYAQVIDDTKGHTLCAVSTLSSEFKKEMNGGNIEAAKWVGKAIAALAKKNFITCVVFDRAGRDYHGRVKALADAAREAGLRF